MDQPTGWLSCDQALAARIDESLSVIVFAHGPIMTILRAE